MILSSIIATFFFMEPQKITEQITGSQLESLIKLEYPKAYAIILDDHYNLTNSTVIKEILKEDKTNLHSYINETFDCDDFAFTLWRNIRTKYGNIAVGVVRIKIGQDIGHILNFYVDKNLTIHLIEPQTDIIDPSYDITDYTWFLI